MLLVLIFDRLNESDEIYLENSHTYYVVYCDKLTEFLPIVKKTDEFKKKKTVRLG